MTEPETKALVPKGKQEIVSKAGQTKDGLVFTPDVDILESDREITLLADIPGVQSRDLKVDLENGVLTLTGDVAPWEGPDEKNILIEYETGCFYRQFSISETIDQERIDARLSDGVLRLTLPKVESAIPRKIPVAAG
ncbi:MAG TPA: Hsp20/alpha crystallin family protein [Syntrophales bacterium]|nr:Hsp20/alpha crystallin family protein [Syntrophales bacterium]HPI56768.1 Hsp20/alpha crystallin family protein [Syntrophales bacterium]HPN25921.1 Hsp20/alpha crystallin family protein [Syntrophales bacterium]HQM28759.1 Hsp20/alpha crystallin family protein [Syntrophales bacterium]